MADETPNSTDRTPMTDEKSFDTSPKVMTKYTIIMVAATILFLIVFGILFIKFLNNPTGGSTSNQNNTSSR